MKQTLDSLVQEVGDRLVRPRDLAGLLAVSKSGLYQLIRDGFIPEPLRIGGKVRAWPLSQVKTIIGNIKNQNCNEGDMNS